MYLDVYNYNCCYVCPLAKCFVGHTTELLEYSWISLRSFGFKDCLCSNFQHIKTENDGHFQILYSEQLNSGLSVTIMHFNQAFDISLNWRFSDSTGDFFSDNISLNRQYFSQQEIFFQD